MFFWSLCLQQTNKNTMDSFFRLVVNLTPRLIGTTQHIEVFIKQTPTLSNLVIEEWRNIPFIEKTEGLTFLLKPSYSPQTDYTLFVLTVLPSSYRTWTGSMTVLVDKDLRKPEVPHEFLRSPMNQLVGQDLKQLRP